MRRSQDAPQPNPKLQIHFFSARRVDVAKVNNTLAFPAEIICDKLCDLFFCRDIVAADKQIMIAEYTPPD
jgi:hypothetical protein